MHPFQNTEEEPIDLETIQTATAGHRRYLSSPPAATLHGKTDGFRFPASSLTQVHATFMQQYAICIHSFQNTEEEPIDLETIQTATTAHRRYLSSPPAATLDGKAHGFVLQLPSQHNLHATFMQPSQCILQHDVANQHVSTHKATEHDNNCAAIPMRSASTDSRNA